MGVRFLHTADLHLGSPLDSVAREDASRADELREATYGALERIVDLAIARDVAFVAVSGDLYDERARSVEANEFLVEQFGRLDERGIDCYVVHGNHDPLHDGAERLDWPANVHVFSADEPETVLHPNAEAPTARILGQSYGQQWERNSLYWQYTPPDRAVPNVGLLHTGLNPDGQRYAPCGPSDLAQKEIDYWALGHIHTPGRVSGAPAAYPGIPQGRHLGETDVGGCFVVEVGSNGEADVEFVPTSPVVWQRIEVDIGGATTVDGKSIGTLGELANHLVDRCQAVREADYSELTPDEFDLPVADVDWEPASVVYRIEVGGRGDVHEQLDPEATDWLADQLRDRLPSGTPAVWIESVRDRSSPPLPDDETLRADDETIDELHGLVDDLRTSERVRVDLREETGAVWEWTPPEQAEDLGADRIALDDDKLDELIDRALRRATDRLALERYDVD